jgi:hypothetical protein
MQAFLAMADFFFIVDLSYIGSKPSPTYVLNLIISYLPFLLFPISVLSLGCFKIYEKSEF